MALIVHGKSVSSTDESFARASDRENMPFNGNPIYVHMKRVERQDRMASK